MAHQDELDAVIAGWTRGQDAFALAEHLQAAGIPPGLCCEGRTCWQTGTTPSAAPL